MKNTVENNKLIAEFMGFVADKSFKVKLADGINISYYYYKDDVVHLPERMQYNCSWDWLMEVVEKIESLNFVVQVHLNSCFIKELEHFINNKAIWRGKNHAKTKIEAVYNACVEFIKWYNNKPLVNPDEVKNNSSTKRDRVLKSIMERYGGLCNLRSAMREDEDVVLVNLCDDLNDEFSEWEVLDEIMAIFK